MAIVGTPSVKGHRAGNGQHEERLEKDVVRNNEQALDLPHFNILLRGLGVDRKHDMDDNDVGCNCGQRLSRHRDKRRL